MLILNIGGEGEVPGAINVNSLVELRRSLDSIVRRGLLIQADFTALPVRSESVDVVVGNSVPLTGRMGEHAMREAYRVLRSGGTIRAHASAGGGLILLEPMRSAGFQDVKLAGHFSIGTKP